MKDTKPEILLSTQEFFHSTVNEALERLKFSTHPQASSYLVTMLDHFCFTDNLYELDETTGRRKVNTLAEMYLEAGQQNNPKKHDMLKRLGDTSLYISGFFSDSLKRKLIDVDYYVDMGERAYGTLANLSSNDLNGEVFHEFSKNFIKFVDVLTYISQKSMVQSNEDLLRLYDRYLSTGSELAREQLAEKGLLNIDVDARKKKTS